jgi:hypothetical protein
MQNLPEATPEQVAKARSILRRRNIGLLFMLLYVPAVFLAHKISGSDNFTLATAILFFVATAYLLASVAFVKCPRCNKMFFSKWYWANGFTLGCVHCGLS